MAKERCSWCTRPIDPKELEMTELGPMHLGCKAQMIENEEE